MRSGLESPHYKLPDPQSPVSVIATEFHGPSNHYKQGSLALLRPGCDVTPPSVPSSRLMWMQENDFKARFEPCSLSAFQRANALHPRSSLNTHQRGINCQKHSNQVWWYGLDPVVTSLQPQLSPHPDAIFFKCQIWTLLITILQRAIVRLCIESRSA